MACFGAINPNVLLILHRQKKNHRNNRMIVAAALDLIHNVSNMTAVLFFVHQYSHYILIDVEY